MSWFGSTSAVHASSASSGVISMCSPSVGCSSLAASSTSALTSTSTRLQRLLAGKGEQMLGQVGAAFGGFVDQPGDGGELGLVGDGFLQDADGAGDHGQDIVEVVRDAAGELADRVHLLRMPQLGFRGLLLGQVAADEEMPADRLRPGAGPVQRDGLAVLVDIARLEIALLCPRRAARISLRVLFEIVGVDEFHRAVPDHVGGLIAEDRRGARADLDEIPRGVGHQDEVVRGIEDAPPLLDFLAERLLRPLAFGDVARDLGDADDLAGGRRGSGRCSARHRPCGRPCARATFRNVRSSRRG